MKRPTKSKAEQRFSTSRKQAERSLSDREKAKQEMLARASRLREQRQAKDAGDPGETSSAPAAPEKKAKAKAPARRA